MFVCMLIIYLKCDFTIVKKMELLLNSRKLFHFIHMKDCSLLSSLILKCFGRKKRSTL